MRLPVPLAWTLVLLALFTSGLLRQFHDTTPASPYLSPIVGNLLFAAVFLILLVAAREWRIGAVRKRGVRLGSLTPLLLMLLVEKWVAISIYPMAFHALASPDAPAPLLDAAYRGMAGVGLILVCVLVSRFSTPTARKAWRRARPARWPKAALGVLIVIAGTYLLLGGLAWALGGSFALSFPKVSKLWVWILVGQAVLAFAEELYFRGLLMSEMERLAPRLGVRNPTGRRWLALGSTGVLFGMEHLTLTGPGESLRQLIFIVSLGLLFGIIVMVSANLHFAGGIHAWINWLLLGAVPYFVDSTGRPALPPGTYIGLTLILTFVLIFTYYRLRKPHATAQDGVMEW